MGYALRVFPHKRTFELLRGPRGAGFPVRGESRAINKINQRNRLRLVGAGAVVRALIGDLKARGWPMTAPCSG